MPKIEPFDKYTWEYEKWFENKHSVYLSELLAVKRLLPVSKKAIDIGVGTGRFAAPLGIELGLEPSTQMRSIAKKRGLQVVAGVAEALPFGEAQFDVALMVTAICFLDNIDAAFCETHRILKPSGYFVVGFIDKNSPLGRFYEKNKKDNKFYRIATFYSVDEVISALKRADFGHFEFVQTIFHPLNEIRRIEPAKDGYGQGSFVVVRSQK